MFISCGCAALVSKGDRTAPSHVPILSFQLVPLTFIALHDTAQHLEFLNTATEAWKGGKSIKNLSNPPFTQAFKQLMCCAKLRQDLMIGKKRTPLWTPLREFSYSILVLVVHAKCCVHSNSTLVINSNHRRSSMLHCIKPVQLIQ